MANPHPTPRLENLRPPWPPGTSGNPAGYSQGRRISDAIENMIDEMGLERSFAATAIAMALGHKHTLRQLVKDPVTGVDVWVEHKPDLAWFKMIVPRPRIEPAPQPMDAVTRLSTILDNIDRKERDAADQGKAAQSPERSQSASAGKPFHVVSPSGAWVPAGEEKAESTGTLLPGRASARRQRPQFTRHSPLATRHLPGRASARRQRPGRAPGRPGGSSRRRSRHDLGGGTTVRPAQRADPERSSRAVQSGPACCPAPWRSLTLSLRDCSRETSAALLPRGTSRVRPRLAGGLGRALAEIAVVACLLLFHQAVVAR